MIYRGKLYEHNMKCIQKLGKSVTAEFYLSFWKLLGQELVDSFNYACEKNEMSIFQKRGIITLIPKKEKDRTLLDHWRPISLLNTGYKVATKSVAARIATQPYT